MKCLLFNPFKSAANVEKQGQKGVRDEAHVMLGISNAYLYVMVYIKFLLDQNNFFNYANEQAHKTFSCE